MLTPLQSAAGGGKTLLGTKNVVRKRELGPHLCILRNWWPSTQASLRSGGVPQGELGRGWDGGAFWSENFQNFAGSKLIVGGFFF
jgi:hypothetical protein